MKIQFVVMHAIREDEVKRFDEYADAEQWIADHMPKDAMGVIEYYIRKVYTNRD